MSHFSNAMLSHLLCFQIHTYLIPLIHQDFQQRGTLIPLIRWGDPRSKPSFWPEDIAPWKFISKPSTPQRHKLPLPAVEIFKIAIFRCLMAQGIDPREHVREDVDQKQLRNKLRTRSLKTLDEAYERFYSLFLLKSEPQEVKHVPDAEESFENEEAIYDEDTFEYSDEDIMSEEEEDSGPGNDRAAAISSILNILASD